MVERQLPKLIVRVRFPSPALIDESPAQGVFCQFRSSGPQEAFLAFRARCVPVVSLAAPGPHADTMASFIPSAVAFARTHVKGSDQVG